MASPSLQRKERHHRSRLLALVLTFALTLSSLVLASPVMADTEEMGSDTIEMEAPLEEQPTEETIPSEPVDDTITDAASQTEEIVIEAEAQEDSPDTSIEEGVDSSQTDPEAVPLGAGETFSLTDGVEKNIDLPLAKGESATATFSVNTDVIAAFRCKTDRYSSGTIALYRGSKKIDSWTVGAGYFLYGFHCLTPGNYRLTILSDNNSTRFTMLEFETIKVDYKAMESEPNGNSSAANSLAFDTLTFGTVCSNGMGLGLGQGSMPANIVTDTDVYSFSLSSPKHVYISATAPCKKSSTDVFRVTLFQPGKPSIHIWSTESSSSYTTVSFGKTAKVLDCGVLAAGTYCVEIYASTFLTDPSYIAVNTYGIETKAEDPPSIADATVSAIGDQVYTGSAITPSPTVSYGSKTLKKGTDYTLSYSNNTAVGTATVTITGMGNYAGTKKVTFKIVKPADTRYALLRKDGTIWSCTSTGQPTKPMTWRDEDKVRTLYIASDVTKVPNRVEIGDSSYSISIQMSSIEEIVFLTNSKGKSACFAIEESAFGHNDSLVAVRGFENTSVSVLNSDVFIFCESLTSITLPPTIRSIDERAFSETPFDEESNNGAWINVPRRLLPVLEEQVFDSFDFVYYGQREAWSRHLRAIPLRSNSVPIYRMYNTRTSEHLYTKSAWEYDSCGVGSYADWKPEGVAWDAPANSSKPVYRLYNLRSGDHHYTTSAGEKNQLVASGQWRYEGVAFYSAKSSDKGSVKIYRVYNGRLKRGQHHYTTSARERDSLVRNNGWRDEGVGFYGLK